jgi:hypothetical protein
MMGSGSVLSGAIGSGQIGPNHLSSGISVTTATKISIEGTNASGLYPVVFTSGIASSNQAYSCSGLFYNPALRSLDIVCYLSGGTTGGVSIFPGNNGTATIVGQNAARNGASTGAFSTIIGRDALASGSSEANSVIIGYRAAWGSQGTGDNVIIGKEAAANAVGTSLSVLIGDSVASRGFGNGTFGNVAIGAAAGTTADGVLMYESVHVGRQAGSAGPALASGTSGGSNIYLGAYTMRGSDGGRWNEIVIGCNMSGLGTNTITMGRTDTASGRIYGNINFPYGISFPSGGITSGGVFTASLGSGLVRSGAISSGQIGINHLAAGAWSANQVLGQDGAGNLDWITPTTTVNSGGITSGMLGIASVNNINIVSGTISNDKLANSAVTIAGSSTSLGGSWAAQALIHASGLSAVTYYPSGQAVVGIASGGIVGEMIADNAITTNDIASGQVTGAKIAATTVANANLVNSAVTIAGSSTALGASWAAAALTTASGLLAGTYYPSGALTIGIASGGITSELIADNAVGTNEISNGSVTNAKLQNSAVTIAGSSTSLGGSWAAQALTTASGLAAGTYYPSGALTIGIATAGVVTAMIASGAVGSNQIASGAVGELQMSNTVANKTIIGDIQTISAQTGAYTLASGDAGKLITVNAAGATIVTIPTNATVPFAVGSHIDFIQLGAGQVTISGNTGVTINYTPGNKLRTQYAGASVIKIATDTWCLVGDIST